MEVKSKPIQITILDFMAILLPGLVWVLLLFITSQLATTGQSSIINSPSTVLSEAAFSKTSEFSWTPIVLSVLVMALIIGYILKPIATRISGILTALLLKRKKKFRNIHFKRLRFPYKHLYKKTQCHRKIYNFVRQELQCSPYKLPGHQPFSTAKRYIRLVAPALWEECERMEAEVRMVSALFLASVYSFLLSVIVLIFQSFGCCNDSSPKNNWIWLIVSVFVMFILAEILNLLRLREVGYVYVNALIANKFKTSAAKESDSDKE